MSQRHNREGVDQPSPGIANGAEVASWRVARTNVGFFVALAGLSCRSLAYTFSSEFEGLGTPTMTEEAVPGVLCVVCVVCVVCVCCWWCVVGW